MFIKDQIFNFKDGIYRYMAVTIIIESLPRNINFSYGIRERIFFA